MFLVLVAGVLLSTSSFHVLAALVSFVRLFLAGFGGFRLWFIDSKGKSAVFWTSFDRWCCFSKLYKTRSAIVTGRPLYGGAWDNCRNNFCAGTLRPVLRRTMR